MRVAIIGGGTIARLFLEHIKRGDMGDAEVVAIVGRSEQFARQTARRTVRHRIRHIT